VFTEIPSQSSLAPYRLPDELQATLLVAPFVRDATVTVGLVRLLVITTDP